MSQRRTRARRFTDVLRKQGVDVQPVRIEGRRIATTFWGAAWCDHLESFGDFANRLPRGRTYVRNGSVCHLDVSEGEVDALVSGTDMYHVQIHVRPLAAKAWKDVRDRCAGRVGSLLELLQGRLSDEVMAVVTDRERGLFPRRLEISYECDCPDWASMCKHVAAVCYGVGARLDVAPALLFRLRGVDHDELIAADAERAVGAATTKGRSKRLAADELSDVFGIDLAEEDVGPSPAGPAGHGGSTRVGRGARTRAKKKASPRRQASAGARPAAPQAAPAAKTAKRKATATRKTAAKRKATTKPEAAASGRVAAKKKTGARRPARATSETGATKKVPTRRKATVRKPVVKKKTSTGKKAPARKAAAKKKPVAAGKGTQEAKGRKKAPATRRVARKSK